MAFQAYHQDLVSGSLIHQCLPYQPKQCLSTAELSLAWDAKWERRISQEGSIFKYTAEPCTFPTQLVPPRAQTLNAEHRLPPLTLKLTKVELAFLVKRVRVKLAKATATAPSKEALIRSENRQ